MWLLLLAILLYGLSICTPLVQIHQIECSCNATVCSQCFCFLTAKRPKLNWANFGFCINKPLSGGFVRTQFYNKYGNRFEPVGPNFYENICKMTEIRSRSCAFVIKVPGLRLYANNFQCPFQSYVNVTNFPPNIVLLPNYIATKNYKLTFDIGCILTNKTFYSVSLHMHTSWLLKQN